MGPCAHRISKLSVFSNGAALNDAGCVAAVPVADAPTGRMSACTGLPMGVEHSGQQAFVLDATLTTAAEKRTLAAPKTGVGVWVLGSRAGSMSGPATEFWISSSSRP